MVGAQVAFQQSKAAFPGPCLASLLLWATDTVRLSFRSSSSSVLPSVSSVSPDLFHLSYFTASAVQSTTDRGGLDNRNALSPGSAGWKSQIRCQQGWFLLRAVRGQSGPGPSP